MLERLKSQEAEKVDLQEKINRLSKMIIDSKSVSNSSKVFHSMMKRLQNHKLKKETPEGEREEDCEDDDSDQVDEFIIEDNDSDDDNLTKIRLSSDTLSLSDSFSPKLSRKKNQNSSNGQNNHYEKTNRLLQKKLDILMKETTRKSKQILECK